MACVYIPTAALGFIKVALIGFFFTCVCAVITFVLSRQYIIDNWAEYKCNPLITPFASAFGKDSAATMKECASANFVSMSYDMHTPFMDTCLWRRAQCRRLLVCAAGDCQRSDQQSSMHNTQAHRGKKASGEAGDGFVYGGAPRRG